MNTSDHAQAAPLCKAYRFEGSEAPESGIGAKASQETPAPPPFDAKAWRAKLDSYLDVDFPDV